MKIQLTMNIKKLDGFDENVFLSTIKNNLLEIDATLVFEKSDNERYHFEISYIPILPGYSYQPVLACFSNINEEYDKVKLISIPQEEIRIEE
ncbi:hypothetical protein RASY3_02370 [Ruminococcus albus SY3]|uniref:Uncharacterized protein n=1 Tax=Ruminococcus albus SY3 TaxID=1341156 RepID=A0A011WVJ2_RUMAL|nr:hypothetical protein [Ruminococcus albus]EXM40990.1 hypothetical protein RASY3_02370 [Ruminococcus albus SY3]